MMLSSSLLIFWNPQITHDYRYFVSQYILKIDFQNIAAPAFLLASQILCLGLYFF